jgi:hypothetical protein
VYLIVIVLALAVALPGLASGGEVTGGAFHTYADGVGRGYDIAGHAHMTRTADDTTLVSTHAIGLAPNTTYGVHVHNQACNNGNGGGHYQNIPGGDVDPYNEIWPAFTTNPAGIGNGMAVHAFNARPEAQSVVIHDTDGKRIACADLE